MSKAVCMSKVIYRRLNLNDYRISELKEVDETVTASFNKDRIWYNIKNN